MIGIAYFCTGVGLSYRASVMLFEIISVICTSSNLKQNRQILQCVCPKLLQYLLEVYMPLSSHPPFRALQLNYYNSNQLMH